MNAGKLSEAFDLARNITQQSSTTEHEVIAGSGAHANGILIL